MCRLSQHWRCRYHRRGTICSSSADSIMANRHNDGTTDEPESHQREGHDPEPRPPRPPRALQPTRMPDPLGYIGAVPRAVVVSVADRLAVHAVCRAGRGGVCSALRYCRVDVIRCDQCSRVVLREEADGLPARRSHQPSVFVESRRTPRCVRGSSSPRRRRGSRPRGSATCAAREPIPAALRRSRSATRWC